MIERAPVYDIKQRRFQDGDMEQRVEDWIDEIIPHYKPMARIDDINKSGLEIQQAWLASITGEPGRIDVDIDDMTAKTFFLDPKLALLNDIYCWPDDKDAIGTGLEFSVNAVLAISHPSPYIMRRECHVDIKFMKLPSDVAPKLRIERAWLEEPANERPQKANKLSIMLPNDSRLLAGSQVYIAKDLESIRLTFNADTSGAPKNQLKELARSIDSAHAGEFEISVSCPVFKRSTFSWFFESDVEYVGETPIKFNGPKMERLE